jgi:hypothetical protein
MPKKEEKISGGFHSSPIPEKLNNDWSYGEKVIQKENLLNVALDELSFWQKIKTSLFVIKLVLYVVFYEKADLKIEVEKKEIGIRKTHEKNTTKKYKSPKTKTKKSSIS